MKYAKALAALVGTVTPAALISFAAALGLEVPTEVAVAIVAVLGALATAVGPANTPAPAAVEQAPYTEGSHALPEACEDCPAQACDACPFR